MEIQNYNYNHACVRRVSSAQKPVKNEKKKRKGKEKLKTAPL
jgi:hypothetical protein